MFVFLRVKQNFLKVLDNFEVLKSVFAGDTEMVCDEIYEIILTSGDYKYAETFDELLISTFVSSKKSFESLFVHERVCF